MCSHSRDAELIESSLNSVRVFYVLKVFFKHVTFTFMSCWTRFLEHCKVIAKLHYTGPTGPDRTSGDPNGPARTLSETRTDPTEFRRKKVRAGPCGSGRVRVVEFSYFFTERRVPQLIPVLGNQPAGDVSHKPGCLYFPLLDEQRHDRCEQFA